MSKDEWRTIYCFHPSADVVLRRHQTRDVDLQELRYRRARLLHRLWHAPDLSLPYTGQNVGVTLGSLDEPEAIAPEAQFGAESRVSWLATALAAPETSLSDWLRRKRVASVNNHQHPDHQI